MGAYSGDGDAPGNLLDEGARGAEGGRLHVRATVAVDDNGDDEVHCRVDCLKEVEGLWPLLWPAELGDEAEEGDVAGCFGAAMVVSEGWRGKRRGKEGWRKGEYQTLTIGKDNVRDAEKGGAELDVLCGNDAKGVWRVKADVDHGDEDGGRDRGKRDKGHIRDALESAGQVADPKDDEADDAPDYGAGGAVCDCVEADAPGENVTAHAEDEEDCLRGAEKLPAKGRPARAPGGEDDLARVGHAVHEGIGHLELADDITRVCGDDAEAGDEDHAADHADGGQHRRQ